MLKQHIIAEKISPMYASENKMNALLPNALQHVTMAISRSPASSCYLPINCRYKTAFEQITGHTYFSGMELTNLDENYLE